MPGNPGVMLHHPSDAGQASCLRGSPSAQLFLRPNPAVSLLQSPPGPSRRCRGRSGAERGGPGAERDGTGGGAAAGRPRALSAAPAPAHPAAGKCRVREGTGSREPGQDRTREGQREPGRTGLDRVGGDPKGSDRTGQDGTREGQTGLGRMGPKWVRLDWAGWDLRGSDQTGQDGTERIRPNWVGWDPRGQKWARACQTKPGQDETRGSDQTGKDGTWVRQTEPGRMGPEGVRSNWPGWDPRGSDQTVQDQT
ncbi:uncharacterized protein ACIBXB_003397 [Morphnus guianensis]